MNSISKLFAAFALVVVMSAATAMCDEAAGKSDQDLIQGTWTIVGLEADGKPEPATHYAGNTFSFTGTKAVLRERGNEPVEFTVTLDASKDPKTIDFSPKGAREGTLLPGIYQIKGDELKMCLVIGKNRPADFTTQNGDNRELFVLKRGEPTHTDAWKKFTSKEHGFTVDLPGEPEERRREAQSIAGPVKVTFYVSRSESERLSYMVMCQKLPVPLTTDRERTAAINGFRDSLILTPGWKLDNEKDFKFGDLTGRELHCTLPIDEKSSARTRVRILVANDHVYCLMVVGIDDIDNSKNVDRYWESFHLAEK